MRLNYTWAAVIAAGLAASPVLAANPAAEPAAKPVVDQVSEVKVANAAEAAKTAVAEAANKPAPAVKRAAPAPSLKISIDLTSQRLTVKEGGQVKHSWPISSGRKGYRTVTGNFRPQWMTKMHYSRKYDNAPMPHSIFFHGGFAIHATYATGRLGAPASHGCVRLAPGNAKTLYNLVQKHGKARTRIAVFGTAKDRVIAKKTQRRKTTHSATSYKPAGSSRKVRRKTAKTTSYSFFNKPSGGSYTWPGDAPRYQPRYGRY